MNKQFIYSGLIALMVSIFTYGAFNLVDKEDKGKIVRVEHVNSVPSKSAGFSIDDGGDLLQLDFQETASKVLDAVVHIKSTHVLSANPDQYEWRSVPDPFKDFFGDEFKRYFFHPDNQQEQNKRNHTRVGSGSGVIMNEEGYVITNNHVIADADDIEVTLHDNRTFKAKVVGTDPATDLALLQIKARDLPTLVFENSDNVNIGQWVMAVGNPLGLNSTVTAGIVSAKGRNINILKEKYAVENFIQTDAAINPGNSGGALVNLDGALIGINTAIASPTGSYTGYGFAIPSNIVSKVMQDLLEYGSVQRGVLGIMIRTVDGNLAKEKNLKLTSGVFVDSLLQYSAAGKAGLKPGDVIISVNDVHVKSSPELQGEIAQYRPGDHVELIVNRDGKKKTISVTLNNKEGNTKLYADNSSEILKSLGLALEDLSKEELAELEIGNGVEVSKIYPGKIRKHTQMKEGFIITHVDGEKVKNKDDLIRLLEKKNGGVMLEGIYKDIPGSYYYAFGMGV